MRPQQPVTAHLSTATRSRSSVRTSRRRKYTMTSIASTSVFSTSRSVYAKLYASSRKPSDRGEDLDEGRSWCLVAGRASARFSTAVHRSFVVPATCCWVVGLVAVCGWVVFLDAGSVVLAVAHSAGRASGTCCWTPRCMSLDAIRHVVGFRLAVVLDACTARMRSVPQLRGVSFGRGVAVGVLDRSFRLYRLGDGPCSTCEGVLLDTTGPVVRVQAGVVDLDVCPWRRVDGSCCPMPPFLLMS